MTPLWALLACSPSPADRDTDPAGGDDTAAVDDTATEPIDCAAAISADPLTGWPRAARALSGTVTWTLRFDADARAAGYTDCRYTRQYGEMAEVVDQDYLCPECTLITTGTAAMTAGYDDCYLQIDDGDAERVEHLGLGVVEGVPHLFRTGAENVSLGDMGPLDVCAVTWEDETELAEGGTVVLTATGGFAVGESGQTVEDPELPRTEPYACGWPLNNPGGPNAAYTLVSGELFPNVRQDDQCGEAVDLWDFRGSYLVIDASAVDCGPCQQMADESEAFKAAMDEAGIPVELVTLLAEALGAINHPADLATREAWAAEFALTSPILGDRGFGYALFPAFLEVESGMSFPSVMVVDPEMRLLYGASGYGGFTEFEDVIRADWSAR